MSISLTNGIESSDPCDLAWCAGFFDGEGSTTASLVNRNNNYYYHFYLKVPQKNSLLLYKFQNIIGGYGKVYSEGNRDMHQLEIGKFEHIQYVICLMWKWLGPFKKEQYKKALSLRLSTKRNSPKYDKRSVYKRQIQEYGSVAMVNKMKRNRIPHNNEPFINPFEHKDVNIVN